MGFKEVAGQVLGVEAIIRTAATKRKPDNGGVTFIIVVGSAAKERALFHDRCWADLSIIPREQYLEVECPRCGMKVAVTDDRAITALLNREFAKSIECSAHKASLVDGSVKLHRIGKVRIQARYA
jgi:predicted RNA-binding Zn-ribbon protein involved in translation (DUF1610 family)